MAPTKLLRVLCFGDSLTAGYSNLGTVYHPYKGTMEEMLAMAFPEYDLDIVVDGKPGDLVSARGMFSERIQRHFGEGGNEYDWTIVLGGTNDLAWGIDTDRIFEDLKQVWEVPLSHGSQVLALTVPEAGVGVARERLGNKRDSLNRQIKEYKRENFHAYDLHAVIPYFGLSLQERENIWDDAVHFTPAGYDLIGQKVGTILVSLEIKRRIKSESPAKRKRVFRDDDVLFEEEGGDSKSINKGYVIVRRKDLT